jgi:uncharacterized membrane protein (DUF4010 family)
VDAILISMSRLHGAGDMATGTAAVALGLATLANMLTKAGIAWTTGGRQVGKTVVGSYLIALIGGGISLWLTLALGRA